MRFNPRQLASVIEHGSFTGLGGDAASGGFQLTVANIWKRARERAIKAGQPLVDIDRTAVALDWQGAKELIVALHVTAVGYTGGDTSFLTKLAVSYAVLPALGPFVAGVSSVIEWGLSKPAASVQPQYIKNRYYTITGICADYITGSDLEVHKWTKRTENYNSKGFLNPASVKEVYNASVGLAIHFDVVGGVESNASLWAGIIGDSIADTGSGLVDLGGKALEIGKWILIAGAIVGGAVIVSKVLPSSPPPRKE